MIRFEVPGQPCAKARPRIGKIGGFARLVPDKGTVAYEARLAEIGADAMAGRDPLTGPLALSIVAYFQVQKGASKKRLALVEAGRDFHTSKPDFDNVAKIVGDGLNGIVWRDDAIIAQGSVLKLYSMRPRLEIEVRDLGALELVP